MCQLRLMGSQIQDLSKHATPRLDLPRDVVLDISPTLIRQRHDNDRMMLDFKGVIGVSDPCGVQGSKEI